MAATQASATARDGMRWIPGGAFSMGSEDFYPEERPVRRVQVDGFWIDERPVTVAGFRRFERAARRRLEVHDRTQPIADVARGRRSQIRNAWTPFDRRDRSTQLDASADGAAAGRGCGVAATE